MYLGLYGIPMAVISAAAFTRLSRLVTSFCTALAQAELGVEFFDVLGMGDSPVEVIDFLVQIVEMARIGRMSWHVSLREEMGRIA